MCHGGRQVEWSYSSTETLPHGHFTAGEKALVYIDLEAGWVPELVHMVWRRYSSLASARI